MIRLDGFDGALPRHGPRCPPQYVKVPHTAGEYVRTCRECGETFIAVVAVADYTTHRTGVEILGVRWLDRVRQLVP